MKVVTTLLVLFFSSLTFAEDIREFEIEGMSIGDTLLSFYDEKTILENIENYEYNNNKFYQVQLNNKINGKFETYDAILVSLKTNDKKYIIYSLGGGIFFDNNIEDCYSKQKEINQDLTKLFPSAEITDTFTYTHPADPTGQSKITATYYDYKNLDSVRTSCFDWSPKYTNDFGFTDHLKVNLDDGEYSKWLMYEAN